MIKKLFKEKILRNNERLMQDKSSSLDSLSIAAIGLAASGVNLLNPGVSSTTSYLDC